VPQTAIRGVMRKPVRQQPAIRSLQKHASALITRCTTNGLPHAHQESHGDKPQHGPGTMAHNGSGQRHKRDDGPKIYPPAYRQPMLQHTAGHWTTTVNAAQYLSLKPCSDRGTTLALTVMIMHAQRTSHAEAHEKQMSMVTIATASPKPSFSRGRMP
jgi:hypothetical protein